MSNLHLTKEYKKLIKAHNKYQGQCGALERLIVDKIEFSFFILYQDSDGFVIVSSETLHNAPLSICLSIINKNGKLLFDDYMKHTI